MKTLDLTLNTENGQISYVTERIQGLLDSIILESSQQAEVVVQSEKGYLLLKVNHRGTKYYAPRAILQSPEQQLIHQDQFDKFHLDEKIVIIIRSGRNNEVKISLRTL